MPQTFAAIVMSLALAAGLSAQNGKTGASPTLTGTWNMGLNGGHVIPVALVLKHDGAVLTGTIAMPTQNFSERKEVELSGSFADGSLKLAGTVDGAAEPTRIEIAGTLNDDGTLEGTLAVVSTAIHTATWTAERLKERK